MDHGPSEPSRWKRLRLGIPPWAEDAVVLFLVERGVEGVEVQTSPGTTWLLLHLPEGNEGQALAGALETYLGELESLHGLPVRLGWEWAWVPGVDWGEVWKRHFHASRLSRRVTVKPSWEPYAAPNGSVVLEIDPGQAFGTGLHATTRMCVAWIDDLLEETGERTSCRALDVGTGTGILAIVLARLGVETVWAVENDPVAVAAARENVRRNGVGGRVRVVEGSLDKLGGERFPLVVANLTGNALSAMAEALRDCLVAGGRLLASGILLEQSWAVGEALLRAGLCTLGERQEEEWCTKLMVRGG